MNLKNKSNKELAVILIICMELKFYLQCSKDLTEKQLEEYLQNISYETIVPYDTKFAFKLRDLYKHMYDPEPRNIKYYIDQKIEQLDKKISRIMHKFEG